MLVLLKGERCSYLIWVVNELLWAADAACEESEAIDFGCDREFLNLIDRAQLI
jgi:hypothetical protein